jgi:nucleotide-binding universal stress UspA family protein
MYKRILVPLDGSKVAEQVLPYARYLAGKLKIPVDLLGAVDLVGITSSIKTEKGLNLDAFISDSVRRSETYLESISKTFPGVAVGRTVSKGKPEEVVIEKAAGDGETLVAMATHGRSGINRWLLGSVAEKVLRGTTNPLLLVRATEHGKSDGENTIKRLVAPLDGSPLAEKVLPHVIALAKEMACKTVLLRGYNLGEVISTFEGYIPDWHELAKEALREAMSEAVSYLDGKVQELKSQGLSEVSSRASEKEPAQEIIDVATEEPNSLIAMCTHGRSGVQRWVLGSVTEKVVRHSNSPVLVIPARDRSALSGEKPSEPIDEMRDFLKYSID